MSERAYPAFVRSDDGRRRWRLSLARAAELFEVSPGSEPAQMAARSIYQSDIPTGDGDASEPDDFTAPAEEPPTDRQCLR